MDLQLTALIGLGVVVVILVSIIVVVHSRRRSDPLSQVTQATERLEQQLRSLSELFLVPRTRGVVGETILAELLSSWLPSGAYEMQYSFQTGARVDAVIKLGSRLVPVDSKFPMEAASRFFADSPATTDPLPADVRRAFAKHISDIANRYILPAENTMAFALMYVPSERVFYSVFVERPGNLLEEALRHNVVPVSPGTLFVYLQTVAYGLRGLALPESVKALADDLAGLRSEIESLRSNMDLAGTHLKNFTRAFDEASGRVGRIELRTDRISRREDS